MKNEHNVVVNQSTIDQAYKTAEFIWCDSIGIIELPFNSDQIDGIGESGDNEPAVDRCLAQCDVVNAILDSTFWITTVFVWLFVLLLNSVLS